MTEKRKMLIRGTFTLLICSLAAFLLAHIYYLTDSTVMMYIELYAEKIWGFLFPLLAVRFALSALRYGRRTVLWAAALAALTRVGLLFPFYYEYYVIEEGYRSGDALLLSLLRSSVMLLSVALHLFLLILLALTVSRAIMRRRGEDVSYGELLSVGTRPDSLYDFSHAPTLVSAVLAATELLLSLIREIIDTVNFLSSSITTLEPLELFSIIAGYVLALALFFIGHFLTLRFGEELEKQNKS